MKIILVGIYLILTVTGLILMKLGGNAGSFAIANKDITFAINGVSLLGFIAYIISFLLYTKIVVWFDLSYIVPICTGISQILILIASKIIFKEQISSAGVIGASLIIIGLIIMNLPKVTK